MSVSSSESADSVLQEMQVFIFTGCATVAAVALFTYSYLVRFGREVEAIWKHPRRPMSWLYILITYPGLLTLLIDISLNSNTPGCSAVYRLMEWAVIIAMAASYAFQILRTYAVCGQRRDLAGLLVILCLPSMAILVQGGITATCSGSTSSSHVGDNVGFAGALAFETVVLCATIWKTWSLVVDELRLDRGARHSLTRSILQNGVLYYLAVFGIAFTQLVTENLPFTVPTELISNLTTAFNYPVRWILLGQFIIELRERGENPQGTSSDIPTRDRSALNATLEFVRRTVEMDVGEPLYPPRDSPALLQEEFMLEDISMAAEGSKPPPSAVSKAVRAEIEEEMVFQC